MRRGSRWLALALGALLLVPSVARADAETDALVKSGVDALAAGNASDAIVAFEALGDRGVVDANMSLDRGIAYARRVELGADLPGDLGRAAHGFEEARRLSRDPGVAAEAARALPVVRAEVARRRARAGEPASMEPALPLGRSIARVASENAWAILALVSSLLLSIGLFARGFTTARRGRVAGAICAALSAPALFASLTCALVRRDERLHLREGVVVVPAARLADEAHRPLASAAIVPEAARVEIVETRGGWSHVHWGAEKGWVPQASVRLLAVPD